jgi:GntR family transcriptional regulator/MocR family aminotransferase
MLGIVLDRELPRSLGSQLCDCLRSRILSNSLEGGMRLPSTRELARELGISRTLVLEAFEQLEAEGYIEGRRGSGSFVRSGSSLPLVARSAPSRREPARASAARVVDFRPGVPALDAFPREAWARALGEAARRLPRAGLGYGEGAGLPALREEVAAYLFRSKGVRAEPADIYITSGCSQALGLVSRALLMGSREGRRAVLENPCQPALSGLLLREGIEVVAAGVDEEGIDPSALPRDKRAVAFVTPSHQYPLGPVLTAPRRAALVEWARATDSIIVEDDFDGEFRYGGAPLQPLRELDPSRVVYLGSFSKSFSPALRLGYAIPPPQLREAWRAYRELMDIHSCAFTQAAMASVLASGAFERHVRRMRRLYGERRSAMLELLGSAFGPEARVMGASAGLHLAVSFEGPRFSRPRLSRLRFDEEMVSRIALAGAVVYPASRYAFAPLPAARKILLLGYGNLSIEEMRNGISAIAVSILE